MKKILLLAAMLIFSGCSNQQGKILIAENGRPMVNIVISENASDKVQFAAKELELYLEKISGADFDIKNSDSVLSPPNIYVGHCDQFESLNITSGDLGKEGFKIQTRDGNLILSGYDDIGTQFAVYTFLEKYLGVRWLWPGELGQVVPTHRTITVSEIIETQQPDYKWRDRGPGGALWGATTGPTEMHARELLLGITPAHQQEVKLWEKRNKWGGLKIYGGHSLGETFPPEKYAVTHPEYYALVNGKRDVPGPDYDYKHGCQICTTNPDVIKVAVDWAIKFFNEHPEYDGVHLTLNDGGGFCECERCRSLDSGRLIDRPGIDMEEMKKNPSKYGVITDRVFTFINQVEQEVQKIHPDKYIFSMAYSRYTMPPQNIELNPMVVPQYCMWSAYRHANPALKQDQLDIARGWANAANRKGIYEYYINGSWPGLHRVPVSLFAGNIKELYTMGYDLYQTQSGDEFAVNGINYYIAGKLLWDTSLDEQKLVDDYFEKGFGKAAPDVKRFYERLENAWKSATENGEDVSCNNIENTRILELYTPQLLDACSRDLELAEKNADTQLFKQRVEFVKKGFKYTTLTVEATRQTKKLLSRGIPILSLDEAIDKISQMNGNEAAGLVQNALEAWTIRDAYAEELKNDYILAYFWVIYNNLTRKFNPRQNLQVLSDQLSFNM